MSGGMHLCRHRNDNDVVLIKCHSATPSFSPLRVATDRRDGGNRVKSGDAMGVLEYD